jgi:prevent-host-death family protein
VVVVTAADVQKNFGQYREAALEEPLIVTAYGKPSVAIISVEEYERLKELDRRAMRLDEMSDAQIEEMVVAEVPPELRYSLDNIPDRP